jgi:hypothetical protein
MKICYNIAIENGFTNAMNDMAFYYMTEENNIEEAIKCYEMAIAKNDTFAMIRMAEYYFEKGNDKIKARDYILQAIVNGYTEGIFTILAFFINNEIEIDCYSFMKILPYLTDELIQEEKLRLYIIENCVKFNVYDKILFGVKIHSFVYEQECNICMDKKRKFIIPSCNHPMCTDCFVKNITVTNTKCFCSKQFVTGKFETPNTSSSTKYPNKQV